MPFYEYQCSACDHRLEVLQKISDEPLLYCPECSEASLKKLISKAAFRLKGTGWYETDFKNNAAKQEKDGKSEDGKASKDESGGTKDSSDKKESQSGKESKSDKASPANEPMKKSA